MRHDRLVKALEKAGYKVFVSKFNSHNFYVESSSRIVSWYKQGDSAVCVNSRRHNDHHDMQSDYSAGYFCDTIKHAVSSLGSS